MTRIQIVDGLSTLSLCLGIIIAWLLADAQFITYFEFFLILVGINIIAAFHSGYRKGSNGR